MGRIRRPFWTTLGKGRKRAHLSTTKREVKRGPRGEKKRKLDTYDL